MKYSIFSLARNALSYHENWPLAWRSPPLKKHYDAVITGGGGHGLATAYVDDDGTTIYLYDGSAVGWIDNVDVYAYSGRYLGWMQEGWLFDRVGNRAFFMDATKGGPPKPARSARPARARTGARRPGRPRRVAVRKASPWPAAWS